MAEAICNTSRGTVGRSGAGACSAACPAQDFFERGFGAGLAAGCLNGRAFVLSLRFVIELGGQPARILPRARRVV